MNFKFHKNYLVLAHSLFLVELAIAFIIKTGFIRYTFGDYLVVILLYAIIRGCTNLSVRASSLIVLLIAYGIEFLQLTPFLTYFNLETNLTAKLIFGSTFHITDLLAYTLGILTILGAETLIPKLKNLQSNKLWKL
ncbi:ribosomal maturation YjgA family protein [Winogradskyella sp. PC D3.3]